MKVSNETKVGVFALVAIVILILGFNYMIGNDLFTSTRNFYAFYDDVKGIQSSDQVYLHGTKVGRVEDVVILSTVDSRVMVTFSVIEGIMIPKGTVAKISSQSLLGGKSIVMVPAESTEFHMDGDTLIGAIEPSMTELFSPVQDKTVDLMSSLDSVIIIIREILNDGGKNRIQSSFSSLDSAMANLNSTTREVDDLVSTEKHKLKNIFSNTESIMKNLEQNNEEINNIISNMSAVSDSIDATEIAQTIRKSKNAIAQLDSVITKINNGQGSIGALINDDKLYNNLESASKNLDNLVKDLKENPGRYVRFSVISIGGGKKKD